MIQHAHCIGEGGPSRGGPGPAGVRTPPTRAGAWRRDGGEPSSGGIEEVILMLPDIPAIIVLLLVATAVAVLARHVRLPYTVALVLGGLALSLALPQLNVPVSKDLILLVLLPPLLFEGTVNMDLVMLRERGWL